MVISRRFLEVVVGCVLSFSSTAYASADAETSDDSGAPIAPIVATYGCPSDPPGFEYSDANVLAEKIIQRSDTSVNQQRIDLTDELREVLSLIRETYPKLSDIHASLRHWPSVLIMVLDDDLTAKVNDVFSTGESLVTLDTGYVEFDVLNEQLGLRSVRKFASSYAFCFRAGLHIGAAIAAYSDVEGVRSVEPEMGAGDGPDIEAEKANGEWRVVFRIAWGDCPSGCTYEEFLTFAIRDGSIQDAQGTGWLEWWLQMPWLELIPEDVVLPDERRLDPPVTPLVLATTPPLLPREPSRAGISSLIINTRPEPLRPIDLWSIGPRPTPREPGLPPPPSISPLIADTDLLAEPKLPK